MGRVAYVALSWVQNLSCTVFEEGVLSNVVAEAYLVPWLSAANSYGYDFPVQKKHQTCHDLKILLSDRNADNFTTISLTIGINLVFKTSFNITQT